MTITAPTERTRLNAALQLAADGFRVFPCHTPTNGRCSCGKADCTSPGKHPRTSRGCKDATCDPVLVEEAWRRLPDANIGVATGGGLLVVDIDGPEAQATLDTLCSTHGSLPATRTVRTGRAGGSHLWFRVDREVTLRNRRLAPGVDTRGEGGYVLVPPSVHVGGRTYEWVTPGVPLAPLPDWLRERLSAPRHEGASDNGVGPPPIGTDTLERRRLAGLGETVLARELEGLAQRSSARGTGRGTAVYACAVRLGRIVTAGGLDLARASRALSESGERLGLEEAELQRSVDRGLAEGMSQPPLVLTDRPRPPERPPANGSRPTAASDTTPTPSVDARAAGVDPWPTLPTPSLPPFPLDALPPDVARWVEAVAEETQTPPDLAAVAALGVLSSAALGVDVNCGAWTEELALYLLVAMPSGERKSPVLRAALAPLRDIERQWRKDCSTLVRERKLRKETLESRKSKLVKGPDRKEREERVLAEAELQEVAEELDAIGEPIMPRLLADDATPEALGGLLARHGQIAIVAAESALIDNLIGRYDASKSSNLHLVCHAYGGEATVIDRRARDAEEIERPLLAITLTVQPHVLQNLIEHPTAREQGLVGRFAYATPESRLGHRRVDVERSDRRPHEAWAATVGRVIDANPLTELTKPSSVSSVSTQGIGVSTTSLSLSIQSRRLLTELRAQQEPRLADGGDLAPFRTWIAKSAGRVAKIAGLLHLAQHPVSSPIGEETMRCALRIGEYFLAHSLAALAAPDEKVRRAQQWLARRDESTVTQRDLHRGPLNSRGSADKALELVETLVALGALRELDPSAPGPAGGRTRSPTFAINPGLRGSPGEAGARRGMDAVSSRERRSGEEDTPS